MADTGPRKAEGWDGFLEDHDDVWYDALETEEVGGNEVVNPDAYDEFANIQEIVNFIAGTGSYEDTNSFSHTREDLEERKRQMQQQAGPQCPRCLEDMQEYLQEGAMKSEIDIDPYMDVEFHESEVEAQFSEDHDTKNVGVAIAYCNDHNEAVFFQYQETWFDD